MEGANYNAFGIRANAKRINFNDAYDRLLVTKRCDEAAKLVNQLILNVRPILALA